MTHAQPDLSSHAAQAWHYSQVRARLMAPQIRPVEPVPYVPAATVPEKRARPLWPEYVEPVPYDHCAGFTVKTWRHIVNEIARKHLVPVRELLSSRRRHDLCIARQEAYYRLKTEFPLSFPAVGRLLNRDHTTVLHGYNKHVARMEGGGTS